MPHLERAEPVTPSRAAAIGPIERRSVAGTDLTISRLVFGAMTFGSQVSESDAATMVDLALDAGINMFDTAASYNDGASERILGATLARRRDDVLIATKVHPRTAGLTREAIHAAIDGSLGRLQTDRVDVYYLHQPDWKTPVDETLEAMNDLVRAGKVRHIGVSNYAAWQIADLRAKSATRGWQLPVIAQQMYNLLARRIEDEYALFARSANTFDIAYNPLAGGLLTGKHRPTATPASGTRFSQEAYRARYWNDAQFAAVDRLRAAAEKDGASLLELAYRWLLSRPMVDAILVGASRVEHLRENLAAARGDGVSAETLAACDEVWGTLRGVAPNYNR
jgi:aryl-alcohol dehydrogenase-like predicted oxidoreductase